MLQIRTFATAILVAVVASRGAVLAATTERFETHAAFFSRETHQPQPLDPQVFVADAASKEATGPQNMVRAAGVRNALLSDVGTLEARNANGKELGFTLERWFSATGSAEITPLAQGRQRVVLHFTQLIPSGVYSMFENQFSQNGVTFTALDGNGTNNSFTADAGGNGSATIDAPAPFTHDNALLLVYDSDGKTYGTERGAIGVAAHHQLTVRFP